MDPSDVSDGDFDEPSSAGELEEDHVSWQLYKVRTVGTPLATLSSGCNGLKCSASPPMDPSDVSNGDFDEQPSAGEVIKDQTQHQQQQQKRKRMRPGRKQKRNAQRRTPQTLFWHSATPSHGVWGGLPARKRR